MWTIFARQCAPLVEDEPGADENEKDERNEFGYQSFERRDGWERHGSPLEICERTLPFSEFQKGTTSYLHRMSTSVNIHLVPVLQKHLISNTLRSYQYSNNYLFPTLGAPFPWRVSFTAVQHFRIGDVARWWQ